MPVVLVVTFLSLRGVIFCLLFVCRFDAYPTGRMNQLVYPVAGGMEDWVRGW